MTLLNSLLCDRRSLLMQTWWTCEAQRKDKETRKRSNQRDWDSQHRKWLEILFVWGGIISFWSTGPECRTVHKGCSSLSAQSQATVLSMMRKKELLPRHDWIILSRAWTELNEWNCSWPSVPYCWWSLSSPNSHLLHLLQSVPLLAHSLSASSCMLASVLYYHTLQGTIL